ncbi:MAG: C39 family peptidase [Phenylobacterium sp.]|jgi:predicted double-glycine peptidase|uniref:C39 family peptidase n=1 Tax=Phenylobacterium sp. TaxID=1871053 RepID=UPI002A36F9B3|nr:C39 family peptidase [Phenylobacterium sp.]MDX9997292.1 C39 family peptidase [Phenylobacterium sp.]
MRNKALLGAAALIALATAGVATAPASAQVALVDGGDSYFIPVRSIREIPFRTVVRQQYDYSCGSAALATLLAHHYGKNVGEAQIFRAMYAAGDQEKIRKVGFSMLDMKKYLETHGYEADGYRISLERLATARAPAITVIQIGTYKHFVVVKGVRDGKVLVGDPALGLKTYTTEEFGKMWNGVAFMIRGVPASQVAYNREDEWRPWSTAPLDERLGDKSLAAFDRQLRPLYQIAPVADLQGFLQ